MECLSFDDRMKCTLTISPDFGNLCLGFLGKIVKRNLQDSNLSLGMRKSFWIQQQLRRHCKAIDWYHCLDDNLEVKVSSERMKAINGIYPYVANNRRLCNIYHKTFWSWSNKNQTEYLKNQHENNLIRLAKTVTLEHTNYSPNHQPSNENFAAFFIRINIHCKELESIELIRCRQVHDSMFRFINEKIEELNTDNLYDTPIPNFYHKMSQLKCIRLIDCMQTIVTKHLVDEIAGHCNRLDEFVLTFEQLPPRYVDVFEESYGLIRLLTNNQSLKVFHVHYHGTDREPLLAAILKARNLIRVDLMFPSHPLSTGFLLNMLNKGSCKHLGVIVKPIMVARIDVEFSYDKTTECKSLIIVNNRAKHIWNNDRSVANLNHLFETHGDFNKIALTNVHRNFSALYKVAKMNPTLFEFRYTDRSTKLKKHFEIFNQLCANLVAKDGIFLVDGIPFDQFTDTIVYDLT